MRYLNDLAEEREALAATQQTIIDTAANEGRDMSDTEKAQFAEIDKRVGLLDSQIETIVRTNESHDRFMDLKRRAAGRRDEVETTDLGAADLLMRNADFTSYSGRGQSPVFELDTRALLKTDTLGEPTPVGGKIYSLADRFPLFDGTNKIMVSGGTVEYIVDKLAPAAGSVAEGTAKPELAYAPTKETGTLATYAHHAKVTRQFWEDEQGAFASMLTAKARAGVVKGIQGAIATAIKATTGTPVTHDASLLAAVRVGIAQVEENGGLASYVLVNPADAAEFDIEVYGATLAGPSRGQTPWGLPVVTNASVTAGTAYVVDRDAVDLYMRNQVSLYMTDSDITGSGSTAASDFRANILTLLAEARALPVLAQPSLVLPCSKSGAVAAAKASK